MSKWKKSLAMVLTAAMLLSVLPVSTWAAESEPEPEDEVVFNLGTMDVTVGTDQARAEEGQEPYDLFQADGSYTLELEPDAFFPYEVQFTHDGQTQQVWFMDPEDTVDVGGHTFSVESSVSDPAAITEMTFAAGCGLPGGEGIHQRGLQRGPREPAAPERSKTRREPGGSAAR